MPNFIELDHTSSGVQIAAALARDAGTASIVNINGGDAKSDLYTEVFQTANRGFESIGSDVRLNRADVKRAVISVIYGGTHSTIYGSFKAATGLGFDGNEDLYRIFKTAIDDRLSGVVTIQRYFEHVAQSVHKAGHDAIEIRVANGALFRVPFRTGEGAVDKFDVKYISAKGAERITLEALPFDNGRINVRGTAKTLVAGFIQSFDAEILARVQQRLAEAGIRFLSKHDAYLIDSSRHNDLTEIVKGVFFETFSDDHIEALRLDVQNRYGIELERFGHYGNYDVAAVLGSDYLVSE